MEPDLFDHRTLPEHVCIQPIPHQQLVSIPLHGAGERHHLFNSYILLSILHSYPEVLSPTHYVSSLRPSARTLLK